MKMKIWIKLLGTSTRIVQINKSKKDPKTKGGGNINSRYSIIVDPVNKELIDINSNRGIEILKNYLYVLS